MRDMAGRLVEQIRGGTPFPQLAQQFSQSPTAAQGGDLGWVVKGDMEPELDAIARRVIDNYRARRGTVGDSDFLALSRAAARPRPNLFALEADLRRLQAAALSGGDKYSSAAASLCASASGQ